jgi:hypothetical protein
MQGSYRSNAPSLLHKCPVDRPLLPQFLPGAQYIPLSLLVLSAISTPFPPACVHHFGSYPANQHESLFATLPMLLPSQHASVHEHMQVSSSPLVGHSL